MPQKITVLQKFAWFYAANFLFIVAISHWPGLTDSQGKLMGLFMIDPIDDIFHFLSGLVAVVVALKSRAWALAYFKYAGIPYLLDAITGIFFGLEFLNGNVFSQGLHWGQASFTVRTLLNNGPHILIPASMAWVAFWLAKRVQ
jgi:hypothetical protein